MISIIVPIYNHPERLKKSLASIVKQTYQDLEVIVIDDGSKEQIETSVKEFESQIPRLHYYRIPHGGANKARQYGFELASGSYVIFWDSDIIARPDMLDIMLDALTDNPRASYAYSSYLWGLKKFKIWPFSKARLKKMPYIHTSSLLRHKHFAGFDPDIERLQDWDLWLTMLEQGYRGIFIPEYLFRIITGGTMSSWLPKQAYKKPFKYLLPKSIKERVRKYEDAVRIIKKKHNL